MADRGQVVSVAARKGHGLGKTVALFITLIVGQGVAGDAHCGVTVKHRSRVAKNPAAPNVRQVHLLGGETLDELSASGFSVGEGELGENVLTRGIDLLALPEGARLEFSSGAVVRITGLRNPCNQINGHTPGLMAALLNRDDTGDLIRKGGVMAVVEIGGDIKTGDGFFVHLPQGEQRRLVPV